MGRNVCRHGFAGQYTQYDRVPFSTLYADWRSFIRSCAEALEYALGEARPELRRYSHVALQMMRAMGWNPGQGIGKYGQGRVEPIPTQPLNPPEVAARGDLD